MKHSGAVVQVFEDLVNSIQKEIPQIRSNRSIEPLHQARVASRRLLNLLGVFKDILPSSDRRFFQNEIHKLVRVFSKARDLDVQIRYFESMPQQGRDVARQKGIRQWMAYLKNERGALQPGLLQALDHLEKKNILAKVKKCAQKNADFPSENAALSFSATLRGKTQKRLKEVLSYKSFVRHPGKVKELHQLRIAAKHLRYTLEAFAPLYSKKLDALIADILPLHDLLGDMHDHYVWQQAIKVYRRGRRISPERTPVFDFLQEQCCQGQLQAHKDFVRAWQSCARRKTWERIQGFSFDLAEAA